MANYPMFNKTAAQSNSWQARDNPFGNDPYHYNFKVLDDAPYGVPILVLVSTGEKPDIDKMLWISAIKPTENDFWCFIAPDHNDQLSLQPLKNLYIHQWYDGTLLTLQQTLSND